MADQGTIGREANGFSSVLVALRAPIFQTNGLASNPAALLSTIVVALRAPLIQTNGAASWPMANLATQRVALRAPLFLYRGAVTLFGIQDRQWPGGRDESDGSPASPCLRVLGGGVFRFRIPVDAGVRSISVKCREASTLAPRPVLRICENAEIGLLAPIEATAPAGTGWVTVGPVTFSASVKGGVVVELVSFGLSWEGDCRWDSFGLS